MTSTLQKQVTEAAVVEVHPPPAAKRPRPNSAGQASVKAPAAAAPKPSAYSAKPKSPVVAEVVARTALATKAAATAAMSDDEEAVHTLAPAGPAPGPSQLAGAATVETAKGPAGGARQSIGSSRSELAPVSGGPSNGKQHAVEGSSHQKKKKKRRSGHGGGGGSGSPAGQL